MAFENAASRDSTRGAQARYAESFCLEKWSSHLHQCDEVLCRPTSALDRRRNGSCITGFEACSAFTCITAYMPPSRQATLFTGGFSSFVASTAAPIATG